MNRVKLWLVAGALGACVAAPPGWGASRAETSSARKEAKEYFAKGHEHQEAKRYKEAIAAYERSLQKDPLQAEALSNLGFCHRKLKQYQKAIQYYHEALELNPKLAEAHEYLGEAYVELGQLRQAEQEYQALLDLAPEDAEELKAKIDEARAAGLDAR